MKGKKGYGHFRIVKCGKVSIELKVCLQKLHFVILLDITGEKIQKIQKVPETEEWVE